MSDTTGMEVTTGPPSDATGLITTDDPRTHKQRMLDGDWFWGADHELLADQARAGALVEEYAAAAKFGWEQGAAVLVQLFARGGDRCYVKPPFTVDFGFHVSIGDGTFVNSGCVLLDAAPITTGANVLIGTNVQLLTAYHGMTASSRRDGFTHAAPITIGDDVWIGAGAIVLPGITIGAGAVVGAGSVVTKDVAPLTVVAGNPARVLRELADEGADAGIG